MELRVIFRRLFVALLAAALCCAPPVVARAIPLGRDGALKLERSLLAAMVAGDVKALDDLTDRDFLYLHGDAHTDTRAEMLQRMGSGIVQFHDIRVLDGVDGPHNRAPLIFTSRDMAIISSKLDFDVTYKGEVHAHDRLTTAWRHPDGRWRAILWQAIPFPSPGLDPNSAMASSKR